MLYEDATIVAISTPPGRGGIGIVRLSGPHAREIAAPLFRLRHPLAAGQARFAELLDDQGAILDQAIVTFFAAPHSATGEDVVEIAAHGAPVLLEHLVRACIVHGARLAEPGEFTQRAFLSGRIDLTQAEAVGDLINAHTLHQARVAAAQLAGSLARAIAPIKQSLVALIAELEAGVDFAEDDLDLLPEPEIARRIAALIAPLEALAATYSYGRILHEGFTLALVGRPNVGKSSLFNRLLERDRAIVTAEPGTTRDPISDRLSLAGIPVELIDTAGLRDIPSTHAAEHEGIRRSRATMAEADLVLHVLDATSMDATCTSLSSEDAATLASLADRPHILAANKADLLATQPSTPAALLVSAHTGAGIEALKQAIVAALAATPPGSDSALITNLRQHQAVTAALAAVTKARDAATNSLPHEFLLLDLYAALTALDTLTGATTADDILHRIFANFCIGK